MSWPLAWITDWRGRAVQRAGRDVDVGCRGGGRQLVDADLARRERGGIGLDAHGEFLRAVDVDLRHAVERRELPRQQRLGVFVDLRERQRVGAAAP